jgi:hypothetical protein
MQLQPFLYTSANRLESICGDDHGGEVNETSSSASAMQVNDSIWLTIAIIIPCFYFANDLIHTVKLVFRYKRYKFGDDEIVVDFQNKYLIIVNVII